MNQEKNLEKYLDLRKACGISQFKLAQLTRISRNRISLWECGYGRLTRKEIERIRKVLEGASNIEKDQGGAE